MKRDAIKTEVEKHLASIGIKRGAYVWQPHLAQLIVVIGEQIKTFTLKSGMSKRALTFELGRMSGLVEATGITPKSNGASEPRTVNEDAYARLRIEHGLPA